jgi:hypothetical protein
MHASHYDDPSRDRFNPSLLTSSGEMFRPWAADNAASPIYPDGTLVAVFAPTTKRGAIVRINNAGPYFGNRLIDLSRGLGDKLGFSHSGVGRVIVEVLAEPRPKEAAYVRGRRYAPVPGYIGKVAGVEEVRAVWQAKQAPLPIQTPSIVRKALLPGLSTTRTALADRLAPVAALLAVPSLDRPFEPLTRSAPIDLGQTPPPASPPALVARSNNPMATYARAPHAAGRAPKLAAATLLDARAARPAQRDTPRAGAQ